MTSLDTIWSRWKAALINPDKVDMALNAADFICKNRSIYQQVGDAFKIPFYIVGAIHYRESSFDFTKWLANGDPLFNSEGNPICTTSVPAGIGPCDSWVSAAMASFEQAHWGDGWHWDLCNALQNCEIWNGEGYSNRGLPDPYIWAGTNQYQKGFYKADGQFDENAIDERIGIAPILLSMPSIDLNLIVPK
jgi:lysozyme family protein